MISDLIGRMTRRFTSGARDAVVAALDEAHYMGHDSVGDEDLLLGVLASDETIREIMEEVGVTVETVREELERRFSEALANIGVDYDEVRAEAGEDFRLGGLSERRISFSPLAKKALEESLKVARDLGENEIRAKHVLLGAVALENGKSRRILENLGVEKDELLERVSYI